MNFNKLRKLLPKKSVLNKNKWLILAIVVVVCVGLYWYSRKNKENFQRYAAGYTYLTTDNVELNRALYENVQVMDISELKNPKADVLITYSRAIRNIYLNGLKAGCTLNQRYREGVAGVESDVTKDAINKTDFYDFFLGEKSDNPDNNAYVVGDEDMFEEDTAKCSGYNKEFKDEVGESGGYFTNAMNETVTVFVAGGCVASDDFLTKIWTKTLTDYLLEKYPTVSLNVEKCEDLKEGTDGRKKEDSMCNLSGLFSTTDKVSTLAYPLIQYSFLVQTKNLGKNLGEDKYAIIQNNFDPTKRYDSTVNFEEGSKIKYSATKIKAWLLKASGGGEGDGGG